MLTVPFASLRYISPLIDLFMKMSGNIISSTFLIATMILTHQSFGQCYRITTRMTRGTTTFPSARSDLWHHFVMLFCFVLWEVLAYIQPLVLESMRASIGFTKPPFNCGPHLLHAYVECADRDACEPLSLSLVRVLAVLLKVLFASYLFAVLSVPELIIGSLLSSLSRMLEQSAASLRRGSIDIKTYCSNIDIVRNSYTTLTKVCVHSVIHSVFIRGKTGWYSLLILTQVFGNNLMLLVLVSLIQLIWKAYFLITLWRDSCSFHRLYESDNELDVFLKLCSPCVMINLSKNVILCYVFGRRLIYLTSRVHKLNKQVDITIGGGEP